MVVEEFKADATVVVSWSRGVDVGVPGKVLRAAQIDHDFGRVIAQGVLFGFDGHAWIVETHLVGSIAHGGGEQFSVQSCRLEWNGRDYHHAARVDVSVFGEGLDVGIEPGTRRDTHVDAPQSSCPVVSGVNFVADRLLKKKRERERNVIRGILRGDGAGALSVEA